MEVVKRFILFDSSCSTCSGVAAQLQEVSDQRLEARSLQHPRIQEMLDDLKPGWNWEPMLVEETDGEPPKIYAGFNMRSRVLKLIGPRNAWKVARLVVQNTKQGDVSSPGRRAFLQKSVLVGASLVAVGVYPRTSKATVRSGQQSSGNLGLSQTTVVPTEGGSSISFINSNGDPSQLDIVQYNDSSASFTLYRNGVLQLSADYNETVPSLSLVIANGQSTYLVPETPVEQDAVAAPYLGDIQTIMALYDESGLAPTTAEVSAESRSEGQVDLTGVQAAGVPGCPCGYGDYGCGRVSVNGRARSNACFDANSQIQGQCSNQWCFGCCATFDCDCICGAGDYFCRCSRSGCGCVGPCV